MKTIKYIFSLLLMVAVISCSEKKMEDFTPDASVPQVTTGDIESNFGIAVTIAGNAVSDGGSAVSSKGICYSGTNTEPTISLDSATGQTDGALVTGAGDYTTLVKQLAPNTSYYYRAYALNSKGIAYGTVKTFTTVATIPSTPGELVSEFFGDQWSVNVENIPEISHYVVKNMYVDGYDLVLTVNGEAVTVAKQETGYEHPSYGMISVEGSGSWEGNVISLTLTFTVTAGSFGAAAEVITLQ